MGLRTTYGGKCKCCRRYLGACTCSSDARAHRARAAKRGEPTVCGQRFGKSGGTCRATTPCSRDHSKF